MGLTDYSRMDKEFYLAGIRAENERIIKLLETHAETYLTTKEAIERDLSEDWHTGFTDAIALINGENK